MLPLFHDLYFNFANLQINVSNKISHQNYLVLLMTLVLKIMGFISHFSTQLLRMYICYLLFFKHNLFLY